MSNLTAQDVAQYTLAFKAKYGRETTLDMDAIEAIILNAEGDMTNDDFAEAFYEAEGNDDRSGDDDNGEVMPTQAVIESSSAYEYSKKMDTDRQFTDDLETNAKAALEGKRGAAVIRRDLVRLFTENTIASVWPIPGSSSKTHPSSNRQLHKYPTVVKDAEGQSKAGEGDWYYDLLDGTAEGKRILDALASIKAVKAGETGKHILPEHEALRGDEIKLTTAKTALDAKRTARKGAIIRVVNLVQKMHRLNNETEMTVELITEDGKPDGVPVQSPKLLYAYNSKDRKSFRIYTIGQLLALDVDKAKGSGGTYNAVVGTTGRQPKGAGAPGKSIPELDKIELFDECSAVYASFFDKLIGNAKATNAVLTHLNSAGTDDLLLSLNAIQNGIDGFLSKPGIAKRLSDLLAEDKAKTKAA